MAAGLLVQDSCAGNRYWQKPWQNSAQATAQELGNSTPLPEATARIVLIIDDLGNQWAAGKAVLALPGKINIGVLPFTPYSVSLAKLAPGHDKEVMLHAPMSNQRQLPLGGGGLTLQMGESELRNALGRAIEAIPHIQGVNNHMGSDLTRMQQPMQWVMQELETRGLYFVDSRTSHETVAASSAAAAGVPHLSRNVFLDNSRDPQAIAFHFDKLVAKAKLQGIAVGIGHPYPETIHYLRESLPMLQQQGVELVYASEAIALMSDRFPTPKPAVWEQIAQDTKPSQADRKPAGG